MANTKYVTFAGDFLKLKEVDILRPVEGILERIGTDAVRVMRRFVGPPFVSQAARGDLENSIMWITANNHSEIPATENLLETPPVHCVDIGSANDHAFYVEEGSSPHVNPEGSDEFVAEIEDWVRRMGWDEGIAYVIIKKIREEGTDAIPFVKPTADKLQSIALPICKEAIEAFWAKQKQV